MLRAAMLAALLVPAATSAGPRWYAPGSEAYLYRFGGGHDAANPMGTLAEDAAGNVYGTGSSGGSAGFGAVFKFTRRPNIFESVIHSFGASGSSN